MKWKFKKITVAYTVSAILATLICAIVIAIVFREVFAFAGQCGEVRNQMETGNRQEMMDKIDTLSSAPRVIDILFLDSKNHITYTAKNSGFCHGTFGIIRCNSQREYYLSTTDPQVVFMPAEYGEIIFTLIFSSSFSNNNHDKYEDSSNKTVDLLIHLGETNAKSRIFLICAGDEITGGKLTVYLVIAVVLIFFLVNQVLLALWSYQNALKIAHAPLFGGILVLFTGTIGAVIYILYKRRYCHQK